MEIETPGSNGAFGPTREVAATTFPHAPRLIMVEAARAENEPSTVLVRYKLSEVSEHVSCVLVDYFYNGYRSNLGDSLNLKQMTFSVPACTSKK